jgi:ABC-type uncharacterized transport system YnjBCD substrate-binding protein
MKRNWFVLVLALCVLFNAFGAGAKDAAKTRLIYMTAGDTNMLALGQNVLGPGFQQKYPNVNVVTIHTGPGNAGSQRILEKILAEAEAKKEVWDVDVAMVHEIFMKWALEKDLLLSFAKEAETWKYVTSPFAKSALGVKIEGYAIPMFHSQTALAYNPDFVKNPPKNFTELKEWVKKNPGKFGYNGIKEGCRGIFYRWLGIAETGKYKKYGLTAPLMRGSGFLGKGIHELREFNKYVTITAETWGLRCLNRGEIWMGPVWVDMFFTFMNEGKLDPKTRLILPDPGMPGQPMYFVIPKKAGNAEMAKKFVEYVTSPAVQAKEIVQRFNWYPGIDGSYIKDFVPADVFNKIYRDVTPEDLQKKGLSFPLAQYFDAMLESYEKWIK